jgi:hypothetical protein
VIRQLQLTETAEKHDLVRQSDGHHNRDVLLFQAAEAFKDSRRRKKRMERRRSDSRSFFSLLRRLLGTRMTKRERDAFPRQPAEVVTIMLPCCQLAHKTPGPSKHGRPLKRCSLTRFGAATGVHHQTQPAIEVEAAIKVQQYLIPGAMAAASAVTRERDNRRGEGQG